MFLIISRQPIEASKIILHERFCSQRNKFCEKCNEVITVEEFEEHVKNHNKIQTKLSKEEKVSSKKTQDTELKRLESTKVNCRYCSLPLSEGEVKEHEVNCGARSATCEYCMQKMLVKDLEQHYINCQAKLMVEQAQYLEDENLDVKDYQMEEDENVAQLISKGTFDEEEIDRKMQEEIDENLAREYAEQEENNSNQHEDLEMDPELKQAIELSKNIK